jgi:hypothetical protein
MKSIPHLPQSGAREAAVQGGASCALADENLADENWAEIVVGPGVADVEHTVRLLSLIADDQSVCLDNRPRVIEALQNHGNLLCEEELEVLREWLGGRGTTTDTNQRHAPPKPLRLRD